jgi:hypothetical protein
MKTLDFHFIMYPFHIKFYFVMDTNTRSWHLAILYTKTTVASAMAVPFAETFILANTFTIGIAHTDANKLMAL